MKEVCRLKELKLPRKRRRGKDLIFCFTFYEGRYVVPRVPFRISGSIRTLPLTPPPTRYLSVKDNGALSVLGYCCIR